MPTDTTPIEDVRNAVGLLTDVLDLVLALPSYQLYETAAINAGIFMAVIPASRDLGRAFAKGHRKLFNGYRRRGGPSELYQQLKEIYKMPPNPDYRDRDRERAELTSTIWDMTVRMLKIAIDAMEDVRRWDKYSRDWIEPQTQYRPAVHHSAEWEKAWTRHQEQARAFGVDVGAIAKLECNWRFRDLTARSHRGLNTRAAFEAAWLAGQFEFAKRLITEPMS